MQVPLRHRIPCYIINYKHILATKNRNISCYVRMSFHKIYFIFWNNAYKLMKWHRTLRNYSICCVDYQHWLDIVFGVLWQQTGNVASKFCSEHDSSLCTLLHFQDKALLITCHTPKDQNLCLHSNNWGTLGTSFADGSELFDCTELHNHTFVRFCLTSLIVCCVC